MTTTQLQQKTVFFSDDSLIAMKYIALALAGFFWYIFVILHFYERGFTALVVILSIMFMWKLLFLAKMAFYSSISFMASNSYNRFDD